MGGGVVPLPLQWRWQISFKGGVSWRWALLFQDSDSSSMSQKGCLNGTSIIHPLICTVSLTAASHAPVKSAVSVESVSSSSFSVSRGRRLHQTQTSVFWFRDRTHGDRSKWSVLSKEFTEDYLWITLKVKGFSISQPTKFTNTQKHSEKGMKNKSAIVDI